MACYSCDENASLGDRSPIAVLLLKHLQNGAPFSTQWEARVAVKERPSITKDAITYKSKQLQGDASLQYRREHDDVHDNKSSHHSPPLLWREYGLYALNCPNAFSYQNNNWGLFHIFSLYPALYISHASKALTQKPPCQRNKPSKNHISPIPKPQAPSPCPQATPDTSSAKSSPKIADTHLQRNLHPFTSLRKFSPLHHPT